MGPAAVYPLPTTEQAALTVLALIVSVALPLYLLLFRPVSRRGVWGLSEIVGVTLLFIPLFLVLSVLLGLVNFRGDLTIVPFSIVTIVQNAAFVALSAYVVMVRYRLDGGRLGLRFDGLLKKVIIGVLAAAATVPLSVGSERFAIYLISLFVGPGAAAARAAQEHLADPLRPLLQSIPDLMSGRWILFLLTVVVPIGEEVFFRGLVYGGLRLRWGAVVGALASAVFFTAVHLQVVHALPIFTLGVLLAVLYGRTGSLLPGMVVHGINNVIAVLSVWRNWGF